MGTRNLVCVLYKGAFVIAQYGQHDGYPEGNGITILKFLHIQENIQKFLEGLQHVYMASEQQKYEAKQEIDHLRGLERVAWGCFIQNPNDFLLTSNIMAHLLPSLHSHTGAGILTVVASAHEFRQVPVSLELDFATNWVTCEWAYVVNLDYQILEIFSGHEKKAPGHRFADIGDDGDLVPSLVSSIPFSELQDMDEQQFLGRVRRDQENDPVFLANRATPETVAVKDTGDLKLRHRVRARGDKHIGSNGNRRSKRSKRGSCNLHS